MDYEVIFESERILFVRVTEKLINDYLNMINDPEIQKYISRNKRIFSFETEMKWIKEKRDKNAMVFSMIEKGTNEFIGNIEILKIINNVGEFGIVITPSKQNKHFGQEAIKRLLKYSFEELNLDGLNLGVFPFNSRGIACYERVGFIKDTTLEEPDEIHMIYKKH